VEKFLEAPGGKSGVLVITVHRPKRLQGPDDNCPECKGT
jgi:hypothetical protein